MKFKLLITLLCLLSLGACGHLKGPSQTHVPDTPDSASFEPEIIAPVESQNEPTDIVTPSAQIDPLDTPNPQPEIADLFDRIRNGFKFPDLQSSHIRQYETWSSEHPTYLKNLFERAEPFLYYIVEQIEKRQLPMELALLPAIESAYKPNAMSRSRAAGLWQFVPATGKHYGLRQDWWYDGRQDVLESTNAALDYLTELSALYEGDWFLALAAYNAGQGTVSRAIKRNKSKHRPTGYQDLKLRKETQRYIPKLIALKNIVSAPERFGVNLAKIPDQPHFQALQLNGQVNIQRFSEQSNIPIAELEHLNAGFLRWASSPDGPHRLLVPLSALQQATLSVQALNDSPALKLHDHKIRNGETLSEISDKYSVSVAAIKSSNNLGGDSIRAGHTLLIPVAAGSEAAITPALWTSELNAQGDNQPRRLVHQVRKGDTLWSIAKKYQVKVNQLLSWNQLQLDQVLSLNQSVTVFTK